VLREKAESNETDDCYVNAADAEWKVRPGPISVGTLVSDAREMRAKVWDAAQR